MSLATHLSYRLVEKSFGGGLTLLRFDAIDNRHRTVATLETYQQWETFTQALDSGADETAAVRAIDGVSS